MEPFHLWGKKREEPSVTRETDKCSFAVPRWVGTRRVSGATKQVVKVNKAREGALGWMDD